MNIVSQIFLAAICLVLLSSAQQTQPLAKNGVLFIDTANGFTITYPQAWRVQPRNPGYAVIFYADSGKNSDNYHTNVSITIYDTTGRHTTLEGHRERILKFIDAFTDSLIIESTEGTTMSGLPGHLLIYRGSQFNKQLKYLKAFVLNNGKVYHVTYTANINEYDKYDDIALSMIQSFSFTPVSKKPKK